MSNFIIDFDWQGKFTPRAKQICGEYLIDEAPPEEDMRHNTDLMVLNLSPKRVACRIRRHEYFQQYRDEFTIRVSRPSGAKTELLKIIEGWGDYILYGFANEAEDDLIFWILGDLAVFRGWLATYQFRHKGEFPGVERHNDDGSSTFRVFNVNQLPGDFIVAKGE